MHKSPSMHTIHLGHGSMTALACLWHVEHMCHMFIAYLIGFCCYKLDFFTLLSINVCTCMCVFSGKSHNCKPSCTVTAAAGKLCSWDGWSNQTCAAIPAATSTMYGQQYHSIRKYGVSLSTWKTGHPCDQCSTDDCFQRMAPKCYTRS